MKKTFLVITGAIILIMIGVIFIALNKKDGELDYSEITLYYYNPSLDADESNNILCSRKGLAPVKRTAPLSENYIENTISQLLKGELTETERAQGITTEYPLDDLALKNVSLNSQSGLLKLEFDDPKNKTSGGSCRVGILWFQIEATAKQFSDVKDVIFSPEWLFQP